MTGFEELLRAQADHEYAGHRWSGPAIRRAALLSDTTPGLS